MTPERISVVVAARRHATRSSLIALVETEPGLEAVGAAGDLPAAVRLIRSRRPHVVLVDRAVLGGPSLAWLPTLTSEMPDVAFFLVGMGDHPGLEAQARRAGAAGYVRLDEAADRLGPTLSASPAA